MTLTDAEMIERWSRITDPREALCELVSNSMFLGTDPYYRDLNDALMEMAERCCVEPGGGDNG